MNRYFIFLFSLGISWAMAIEPINDPDVRPHLQRGYFELPEYATGTSSFSLQEADDIKKDFLRLYQVESWKKGQRLEIIIDWKNPYFSAHALFGKTSSKAIVWGGFLRAPGMTRLVLIAGLCHELGHIMGGPPFQTIEKGRNFSTEGQSDFYAAYECLPRFAEKYPHYFTDISAPVASFCRGNFACEATLEAGFETVSFLQKWSFAPYRPVSLSERAPPTKDYVANTYPSDQCRLDSFIEAARCLRDGKGSCRPPSCWWPWYFPYPVPSVPTK